MKLSHYPARFAAGALILNSGWDKRNLPDEAAQALQLMGARGLPGVEKLSPKAFGKLLSRSEMALGAALLVPAVPSWLAGAGLAGFSAALMSMYFRTPEMTKDDGLRPTDSGTPIAKDIVLFGTAVTLIVDDLR